MFVAAWIFAVCVANAALAEESAGSEAAPEASASVEGAESAESADTPDAAPDIEGPPVELEPARPDDPSDQESFDDDRVEDASAKGERGEVVLRSSREADARLSTCISLVAARRDAQARRCLDDVVALGDDTTAALRASALRAVLDVDATSTSDARPEGGGFAIPPGRLELSSTAGLFGVWNGVAGGISIAAHLPSGNPAPLILGTGALATALGVGYGVGGYFLADALDLGEGDSRLVASSLLWGTTFGIASLPALLDVVRPSGGLAVSLSLSTIVAAGFAGGGTALALASFTDFSAPRVSLINTGGWVGGLFGLLAIGSLTPFAPPLPVYSGAYLFFGAAGLLVGGVGGALLDVSWGETLLLDLGGVLGTVVTAAVVMSLTSSGALNAVPSTVLIPVNSTATAFGTLAGIGAGLGAAALLQGPGESVLRSLESDVAMLPPMPTLVLDKDGQLAPMLLGPTFVF